MRAAVRVGRAGTAAEWVQGSRAIQVLLGPGVARKGNPERVARESVSQAWACMSFGCIRVEGRGEWAEDYSVFRVVLVVASPPLMPVREEQRSDTCQPHAAASPTDPRRPAASPPNPFPPPPQTAIVGADPKCQPLTITSDVLVQNRIASDGLFAKLAPKLKVRSSLRDEG